MRDASIPFIHTPELIYPAWASSQAHGGEESPVQAFGSRVVPVRPQPCGTSSETFFFSFLFAFQSSSGWEAGRSISSATEREMQLGYPPWLACRNAIVAMHVGNFVPDRKVGWVDKRGETPK